MPATPPDARSRDTRWPLSLGFKLLALALLLLALAAAAGFWGAWQMLGAPLERDLREHEAAVVGRTAADLESLALRIEGQAHLLARIAVMTPGGAAALRTPAPDLLSQDLAPLVSALGFWPEPNSVDIARDRASSYWVLGVDGKLEAREGYNDPRAVPYYREPWYTPARYAPPGRCYWTPVYFEPLVKRDIFSCAMAMRSGERFVGVVTLSVSLAQLNRLLEAERNPVGYRMLLDALAQPMGLSAAAQPVLESGGKPRNLAELAQRQPALNPLAIALHRAEATADPAAIAELVKATRGFADQDAAQALAQLQAAGKPREPLSLRRIPLDNDPVLGGSAFALVAELPASGWNLVGVLPADKGLAGARHLLSQTLLLAGALAAALILALLLLVRATLLAPLRAMVARLAAITPNDKPGLNERPRNEMGALAYWINERMRQLREHADHVGAGQLQANLEAKERRALIERLARFQERTAPVLQTVRDAVIGVDDQGNIEEMNPAAEKLTGVSTAAARGRPLADIVDARSAVSEVNVASALLAAIQRGERLDPREDFQLRRDGDAPRDIHVSIIPIRSSGNRISGAMVVLFETGMAASKVLPAAAVSLPRRVACERRIEELAAAAQARKSRSAALIVDLDHLRQINEQAGRSAGDEAIRKLSEMLTEKTAGHGQAFHLHADRFALLLPGFDAARAGPLATAIREAVARLRLGAAAQPTGLTVSIGIADFGGDSLPAEALGRAEDACMAAKRAGRNAVKVYEPNMERTPRDVPDEVWIKRVRAGIDQNRLHLSTQLVSSVKNRGAANFESVLSLEDEEGFWAPASAFMPAAERHGLAAAIDRWHIGSVAAQLSRADVRERVHLALVRVSLSSVFDRELPDFLIQLTDRHKNLAGSLCIELTEPSIASYPQQASSLAKVLRAIGIHLAIGDFMGRDPAALSLVRQMPAEILRVDASRYALIASETTEQKLADSVIQMARALEREAWVYGIDSAAALELWKRLNPDHFQGSVIAPVSPMLFQQPR
jgi:diguanylate cyclase (GGDEF)-like protein/PAS domain S-box-containing protein